MGVEEVGKEKEVQAYALNKEQNLARVCIWHRTLAIKTILLPREVTESVPGNQKLLQLAF